MYISPPPQNTPPRAQPVPVRRRLFQDWLSSTSPISPSMLLPYNRFHQPSPPTAFLYTPSQCVPFQEHAELIFGELSDTTPHSDDDEVSIEMEWANDGNDEELNRHMIAYERGWSDDEDDEDLNRHMDTYEMCTPVLRLK